MLVQWLIVLGLTAVPVVVLLVVASIRHEPAPPRRDLTVQERIRRAEGFTVRYGRGESLGGTGFPGKTVFKDGTTLKVDGRRSWVGRSRFEP